MIPHPTPQKLLATHGNTAAGRAAARAALTEAMVDAARAESMFAGRSLMCRYRNHGPNGCRNSGGFCLCECHDPASEVES